MTARAEAVRTPRRPAQRGFVGSDPVPREAIESAGIACGMFISALHTMVPDLTRKPIGEALTWS
ncbi:hypothetical protein [Saccharopolyspora hattusasensis]|uniref:hypothetical protein n=1 Tax=Saccharopolyspora hattusasensis TaxID=1128679 RepID=UPI003D95D573